MKILRLPAVSDRVGLSRSTIYEMIQRGEFPKPVRIGKRAVGWPESEVNKLLADRMAARDGEAA